jgi:hypothetical protein
MLVERQRHFIQAMSKSIDGRPVSESERALLEAIFQALLHGQDVSGLTGVKPPRNRRSADQFHIALHYLCLTKLMHQTAEAAWRVVGDAWGLKRCDVQWVIARNRAPALALMRQFASTPDTLLRLCERHARAAGLGAGQLGLEPPTEG